MRILLLIVSLLLPAAEFQRDYTGFQTVEVAPGIYTYVGPECTPVGLVTGNVTAIIGDDGVLVVDSGHFPSSARKMIAHLKSVTRQPVKYLLNTHWHQDHVMGNIAFKREWPQVEILAHPFTVAELSKQESGAGYAANLLKRLPEAIVRVEGILSTGKLPNGTAISDAQREGFQERLDAFRVSLREAPEMEFVPATQGIESDTELWLGQRKVQIRYVGEGNTQGDLIVYVPDTKVLLTGDMVVYPTPFALDSQLEVWAETLNKLIGMETATIVPGHGPPMKDKTYLRDVRRLLKSMEEQTLAAIAGGTAKTQALEKIDVDWFREKYVTTKDREGSFQRWFLQPIVDNAYKAAEKK